MFGIGAQKTPVSFQNACDRFTFTEVPVRSAPAPTSLTADDAAPVPATTVDDVLDATAVPLIEDVLAPAVRAMERDDGWAPLSSVGAYMVNNHPSFDSRNYGSPRLGQLVRSLEFVEVELEASTDGSQHPYVRLKPVAPRRAAAPR